jgi:hypothetical protein
MINTSVDSEEEEKVKPILTLWRDMLPICYIGGKKIQNMIITVIITLKLKRRLSVLQNISNELKLTTIRKVWLP